MWNIKVSWKFWKKKIFSLTQNKTFRLFWTASEPKNQSFALMISNWQVVLPVKFCVLWSEHIVVCWHDLLSCFKKKIKYSSSLLAMRLADRCKAPTFLCLGCRDEGPQSQLCSQKPPWPNKHTKIFLWVVMFRDCHSNKSWLSGWQCHLHAATRARAGHNTTVCPNREVRGWGAGGGGSNCAFLSPLWGLLSPTTTNKGKWQKSAGPVSEVNKLKNKGKKTWVCPISSF